VERENEKKMIINSKDDVLSLSGSLHKNQWMTIKAAANLLLQEHPQGIIIDCSELEDISEGGARTFLDALHDIEAAHARIIVANLPERVFTFCKTIPGVRSQLPIANSVEEARKSLLMTSKTAAASNGKHGALLLVPLLAEFDLTYGAELAGRLARAGHSEVRLIYFLEVARNLPLNAPLLEEEQAAQETLAKAHQRIKPNGMPVSEHLEKVREAADGILTAIKAHHAEMVILGASQKPVDGDGSEQFQSLVETLIKRAPCEVVVGRQKLREAG
jgi:nucleotide-binding universal stress UspA family protein